MAAERGLAVAGKPKSQDLCFIPDGRHQDFLQGCIVSVPGDIVDPQGKVLGRHRGIAFYTVGQRTGLGIATGQRLFVLRLDAVNNTVIVGSEDNLLASGLRANNLSFVGERPQHTLTVKAKIRFRSPDVSAMLNILDEGAEVLFDQPQRAIAPGQAVVFYQGDELLGGGTIEAS
jgi:tRNA-specific 2-thiouridylase